MADAPVSGSALKALIEKWRTWPVTDWLFGFEFKVESGLSEVVRATRRKCADELEAALAVPPALVERFEAQLDEWDLWDRDPNEAFERSAAAFYAETGFIAPGKSVPMEMAPMQDDDLRRQRYNEWSKARRVARHQMLREVLAVLAGRRLQETKTDKS